VIGYLEALVHEGQIFIPTFQFNFNIISTRWNLRAKNGENIQHIFYRVIWHAGWQGCAIWLSYCEFVEKPQTLAARGIVSTKMFKLNLLSRCIRLRKVQILKTRDVYGIIKWASHRLVSNHFNPEKHLFSFPWSIEHIDDDLNFENFVCIIRNLISWNIQNYWLTTRINSEKAW